jgi:NarL family two-component system sensor histidine kinase LiaS
MAMLQIGKDNLRFKWVKWSLLHAFNLSALILLILAATHLSLTLWNYVYTIALLLGLYAVVVGFLIATSVKRKLETIERALAFIAGGRFDYRVSVDGEVEWRQLSKQLNRTAGHMEEQVKTLQRLAEQNAILAIQNKQTAIVEERRRIARDLHDSVNQQLFSIQLMASTLQRIENKLDTQVELNSRNELEQKRNQAIHQLVDLSSKAQKEMRSMIHELRPKELDEKGLSDRLKEHFTTMCTQHGWKGRFEEKPIGEIHKGIEEHLYRIVQEALHNISKHAHAEQVELFIERLSGAVQIRIMDDGVGFSLSDKQTASYGISSMKERAAEIGGKLEVLTKPELGTQIIVRVPIVLGKER